MAFNGRDTLNIGRSDSELGKNNGRKRKRELRRDMFKIDGVFRSRSVGESKNDARLFEFFKHNKLLTCSLSRACPSVLRWHLSSLRACTNSLESP